ncbi:MAG: hypothetical protein KAT35_04400, partial [Candidatus Aenigmarchaeota archaeon]|nr:hypothetical protein [Candidatus Aenigmarchaeota archaeon]
RTPSTDTLTRCMDLLIKPMTAGNGTVIVRGIGKDVERLTPLHQQGIPVIAIHGTHERRVKGLINPIQALEKAGFLIYLHASGVIMERNGERACIQGMSGVPDQFSEAVLRRWNPKPERNCFNIFMIHQSVSPFMYAQHLLPINKFPRGFDLYVLGHMHESKKTVHSDSTLLIPGSLIPTKLTKEEISPRGFWIRDTRSGDAAFLPLDSQRRVYCIEHDRKQTDLEKELEKLLEHPHHKKPLIRVSGRDIDVQSLNARFGDRSIISVRQPAEEKPPQAVGTKEHMLSVRELGKNLLGKNLESAGLDTETFMGVFDLLVNDRGEEALRLLNPGRQ